MVCKDDNGPEDLGHRSGLYVKPTVDRSVRAAFLRRYVRPVTKDASPAYGLIHAGDPSSPVASLGWVDQPAHAVLARLEQVKQQPPPQPPPPP